MATAQFAASVALRSGVVTTSSFRNIGGVVSDGGGSVQMAYAVSDGDFFILYFLKTFFTEIYFRFHILQFYTPTAR